MRTPDLLLITALLGLVCGTAAAQAASPYAGSAACQTCHEDIYNNFVKSPHHGLENGSSLKWSGRACEACHGPGAKHAESASAADIRNPAKIAPDVASKVCLSCHLNQATPVGDLRSSHANNAVACTTCHFVHGPKALVARSIATINEQCRGCHLNVWAQFQRPFRHKLPEQAMSCVDCHNPHGSVRRPMAQNFAGSEPGCFQCHADKRGPFTFEHAPVRFEGCSSCHEPHGSANPRMLARHEVRFVCLECHANLPSGNNTTRTVGVVPPAFHDLRSPTFQNCTVCHQKIHGSYVNRDLLQ